MTRIAALSDGVIAIAITLLVLDLKSPEPPLPGTTLRGFLAGNVPDLLAWLVSFLVVARLWLIHHHVLAGLDRCRAATIVANFAFLGAVSVVPFGASLVGTYEFDEPLSVVVFSATLGLSALLLGVLTRCAAADDPRPGADLAWHRRHHLVVVPGLAVAAAALCLVEPLAAMALWIAESVTVLFTLTARSARGHR